MSDLNRPTIGGPTYDRGLPGLRKYREYGVDDPFFILHMVISILYLIVGVVLLIICRWKQKTVSGLIVFSVDRIILGIVAASIRVGWLPEGSFNTLLIVFELGGAALLVNIMGDALYWDGNQKGARPSSQILRFGHQVFASLPVILFLAGGLVGQYVKTSQGLKIGDGLVIAGCFVMMTTFIYLIVYAFTRTTSDLKEGRLTTPETALLKATKGMCLFLSLRLVWAIVTAFQGRRQWWRDYHYLYAPSETRSVTEYLKYGILNLLSEFVVVMVYTTTAWMLAKWERVRWKEEKEARTTCMAAALGHLEKENREIGELLEREKGSKSPVSRAVAELSAKLELVPWEKQPMDSRLRRLVAVTRSKSVMVEYARTATLGLVSDRDQQFKQAVVGAVIGVGIPAASQKVFAAHEEMLRESVDPTTADVLHASLLEMTLEDDHVGEQQV